MWEVSKRVRYRLIIDTVITRVTVFLLQFIFSSFDFSTDAFKGLKESETWIDWTFRGFMRWDSIQFLHVAEHGYVYEHSLAFFPLFPTVLRYVASLLETVSTGVLYSPSTFVLAAVILNSVTFFVSSLLIFDICFILTSSHKISQISTLLFSINPASIFFSSIYTESLYCCLSLLGIRLLISSKSSLFFTTLILSLAFLTRSNGLLNIGYLLFYEGLRLVGPRTDRLWNRNVRVQFLKIGIYLIRIGMAIACILFALQIHSNRQMKRFCSEPFPDIAQSLIELGQRENLSMIGTPVAWCTELSLIYPPFYSSIQGQYWDVNLFGYWKMHKIPCFLLAGPALFFTMYSTLRVINRLVCHGMEWVIDSHGDCLPFALHSIVLAVPALLIYNVEVFTRIVFSSSPFLYIEMARLIHERTPKVTSDNLTKLNIYSFLQYLFYRRDICCLISVYFFIYFLAGTAMHSSFLPFT